ncbi:MAG: hypothetical protein JSV79_14060 [Armatimonadota bacterium]|nr:MAG: hypothetical protein JSV79_14060 [Armatimonadota bacterium]
MTAAKATKSPALAGILSFLIVGVGQMYNGQVVKGILMFLAGVITGALCLVVVGFFLFPIVWVWSIVDAAVTAGKISRGAAA